MDVCSPRRSRSSAVRRRDGARPARDAERGPAGAAVRRRPPVELRWLRVARARARLRSQRLRRDPGRSVRVGRQAAGGELRDRRAGPGLRRGRSAAASCWPRCAPTARRCGGSPAMRRPRRLVRAPRRRARSSERLGASGCRARAKRTEHDRPRRGAKDSCARSQADRRSTGSCGFVSDPPLLVPLDELHGRGTRRHPRAGCERGSRAYREHLPTTGGTCWRATGTWTWLGRSSASAASVRGAGWPCCSAETRATRCSSRSRRRSPRCSSRSLGHSPFATRDSASSRASGCCRRPATSSSAGFGPTGVDGGTRDFYVRQLWDWKISVDLDAIPLSGLTPTTRLRLDARPRARALRRPDRNRLLPGPKRPLRPSRGRVRRGVRGRQRAGSRRARPRRRRGPGGGHDGRLIAPVDLGDQLEPRPGTGRAGLRSAALRNNPPNSRRRWRMDRHPDRHH